VDSLNHFCIATVIEAVELPWKLLCCADPAVLRCGEGSWLFQRRAEQKAGYRGRGVREDPFLDLHTGGVRKHNFPNIN